MSKWSDDGFLDSLRALGDEAADACAAELIGQGNFSALFRHADSNTAGIPADLPAPLESYFESTRRLPPDVEIERINRGEDAYEAHAFPVALVLLARSLPEGYAAPCLARILSLSGDLDHHPYRRLLGVLQMVVNVTTVRGFQGSGDAVVTAQKVRLLHAGVRHIARTTPTTADYEAQYGVPVNLEDMLGTVMGFSYLVIDGLPKIDFALTQAEAEDMYYLWSVFARVMGIHPPGRPESDEFVPRNMTEAAEFYRSYARRHYVNAKANPQGVRLARENLQMLVDMLPRPARWFGLGLVPRLYMQDLIGEEGCARVGIHPVAGHALVNRLMVHLGALLVRPFGGGEHPKNPHDHWSRAFFQGLINKQYDGQVTFLFPQNLDDLHDLA